MKKVLVMLFLLAALPLQAAEIKATVLYYRIGEPGIDPYLSRWLVTDQFLRIDEGEASDNYLLFDRRKRSVHSVVHGDRTVLDIPYRAVGVSSPLELKLESRIVHDEKLPPVDGEKPLYRDLYVNGEHCLSVVSVSHLLPDAVKAMSEYRQVMAGEHAKNMANTPLELQRACELSQYIFNPLWSTEQGLPIQQWEPQGKVQSLLDYKTDEAVEEALFAMPQGYRHYQTLNSE